MNESSPAKTARPGDILLFYNAGGFARLVTWFTQSPFYHVGICSGDQCVVEARPRGVVFRDLRAVKETHYLVIPAPEGSGPRALAWAREQLGDTYDVFGVAVIVLEKLFTNLHLNVQPNRNRFSCGELVLCSFQEAGVNLLPDKAPEIVVPADFARLLPHARRADRRFKRIKIKSSNRQLRKLGRAVRRRPAPVLLGFLVLVLAACLLRSRR